MDADLKRLLVEVARGVLRALDSQSAPNRESVQHSPTLENLPAKERNPTPFADNAVGLPQRGDAVRVWAGDRYETGIVQTICRGTPRKLWVSISRGEGKRAKRVRVESDKAVVVKVASRLKEEA
jgi:hypothetical protein